MKYVWKPLAINHYQLYQVRMAFPNHPGWDEFLVVAAQSSTDAANIVRNMAHSHWTDPPWIEIPLVTGYLLKVLQPDDWKGEVVDGLLRQQTKDRLSLLRYVASEDAREKRARNLRALGHVWLPADILIGLFVTLLLLAVLATLAPR